MLDKIRNGVKRDLYTLAEIKGYDRGRVDSDAVITIFLFMILGAYLLPSALDAWFNASTGDWDSDVADLWPIVPLIVLIALIVMIYRRYT